MLDMSEMKMELQKLFALLPPLELKLENNTNLPSKKKHVKKN